MRKFPVILTGLLVAGVVMATSAFTHPMAVRNGIVVSYSPGASVTIRDAGYEQTYLLRGSQFAAGNKGSTSTSGSGNAASTAIAGLGVGAHVTVFAECFGGGSTTTTASSGLTAARVTSNSSNANANGKIFVHRETPNVANGNRCIALFVLVRQAAGASTGTSGTGTNGATSTTSAPSTVVTSTPSSSGTGAAGTETPIVTMTPTP